MEEAFMGKAVELIEDYILRSPAEIQ